MGFWFFGKKKRKAKEPEVRIRLAQKELTPRQRAAMEGVLSRTGEVIASEAELQRLADAKRILQGANEQLAEQNAQLAAQMSRMIPEAEVAERLSRMVSKEEFERVSERLRNSVPIEEHRQVQAELEAQKTSYRQLEEQIALLREQMLSGMVSKEELSRLEEQLRTTAQGYLIRSLHYLIQMKKAQGLQEELAQAKEKARIRGRAAVGFFRRLLQTYSRLGYGNPPSSPLVAFCCRDAEGVIASAQLSRTGAVAVVYPPVSNWSSWLSRIDTHQERAKRTPKGMPPKAEIKVREVILAGFYPTEADRSSLQKLYANGIRLTLIVSGEVDAPDFTTAVRGASLPRAVEKYLSERNISGSIYETLAALGDACRNGGSEEAAYLRDSLFDPTDTGYIRSLVEQLSAAGTIAGSPVYEGVVRKAELCRSLRKDGFRI